MQIFLDPNYKPKYSEVEQALKNFGFYHSKPDVFLMYAEYVNHGNYGYAGGVLDQPDIYWHDMHIMKMVKIFVENFLHLINQLPPESQHTIDMFVNSGKQGGLSSA